MKIASGKLDRRLTIFASTSGRDTYGEKVDTLTPVATTYAQRLEIRTVDAQKAALQQREISARVLIRYRDDLTVGQRVALDAAPFTIIGIDAPDRRVSLILTLAEVV